METETMIGQSRKASMVEAIIEKQAERIKELKARLETERMRLAGCGVAALGYFDSCGEEYKSESLDETLRLYAKYKKQSAALKLARAALLDAQSGMRYVKESYGDLYGVGFDRVDEKTSEALAAIDALGE